MLPDQLVTAPQLLAVLAVLTFLVMLVNGVLSLWAKLRPREDNATIINKLTALTTRFDALDFRCTKIENSCASCKGEYAKLLGEIHEKVNGVKSTVDVISGELKAFYKMEAGKQ